MSEAAKTASPSDHIESLAKPKSRPDGPFRDPQWAVPKTALEASPSERVMDLAKPKRVADGYQPNRNVVWKVSTGAKNASASERLVYNIMHLDIKYRVLHVSWLDNTVCKYSIATISLPFTACRLCDLSKPIVRDTMDHVQFNPDAFNVSEAAKKARASTRIEELAQPIRRGS